MPKISKKTTKLMFYIASRFWKRENKHSGFPYVWIQDNETGETIIFLWNKTDGDKVIRKITSLF